MTRGVESAQKWIERLELRAHPEGGHFRETYRSEETIGSCCLPERFPGARNASTAIYFLLRDGEVSALHRIRSDEIWHFHAGSSLTIHVLIESPGDAERALYRKLRLGLGSPRPASRAELLPDRRLERGVDARTPEPLPQRTVPAGAWFGAEVDDPGAFTLASCTVSPGFDFADFELGERETLESKFPEHRHLVRRLTKPRPPR